MGNRIIRDVAKIGTDEGLVSRWIFKELKPYDRSQIDARFSQIERLEGDQPKWLKPYKKLKMMEIKVDYAGKAVRFLCHETGVQLVLLVGCIKKGQIDDGTEKRAARRRKELIEGQLYVRDYPLPTR